MLQSITYQINFYFSRLMLEITNSIKNNNDVIVPIRTLLRERNNESNSSSKLSVYREILFLSIVVLERDRIDIGE
jgi:hypothetical protein